MVLNVRVSPETIDLSLALQDFAEPEHGARIVFAGVVRNRNHGRQVSAVEYDAFLPLAEATLREIGEEARERFGKNLRLLVRHRVGTLAVGEASLLIVASSPHRDEAYRGSRYVIEEIKKRVPIWKKEVYLDGESEWLRGHALCEHVDPVAGTETTFPDSPDVRYSRQIRLKEVGVSGQARLSASRVLVVGAGGLGSPALLYLASAGIGTIGIIDGDRVDVSNLQRQVLYRTEDAGRFKVEAAYDRLRELNPLVNVRTYAMELTVANACEIFAEYDLILDGTDRFSAKALINDAARKVGRPWIYASVQGFEAQMAIFDGVDGSCLRCLYPDLERSAAPSCGDTGVLGPWVGMVGSQQALAALRHCLGDSVSFGRLRIFDGKGASEEAFAIPRRPRCPTCAFAPADIALPGGAVISPETRYLDVRREDEWNGGHLTGALHWPLSELENGKFPEFEPATPIVAYCVSGARAQRASELLRARGFTRVEGHTGSYSSLGASSHA